MMNRREQTSMPQAGFGPTVSASKRSRPTPQPAQLLGPSLDAVVGRSHKMYYDLLSVAVRVHPQSESSLKFHIRRSARQHWSVRSCSGDVAAGCCVHVRHSNAPVACRPKSDHSYATKSLPVQRNAQFLSVHAGACVNPVGTGMIRLLLLHSSRQVKVGAAS
jgi:hypothetical protein